MEAFNPTEANGSEEAVDLRDRLHREAVSSAEAVFGSCSQAAEETAAAYARLGAGSSGEALGKVRDYWESRPANERIAAMVPLMAAAARLVPGEGAEVALQLGTKTKWAQAILSGGSESDPEIREAVLSAMSLAWIHDRCCPHELRMRALGLVGAASATPSARPRSPKA